MRVVDTVNPLSPGPHELEAIARRDVRLEFVGTQIHQQFEHGLVDHVQVQCFDQTFDRGFRSSQDSHG